MPFIAANSVTSLWSKLTIRMNAWRGCPTCNRWQASTGEWCRLTPYDIVALRALEAAKTDHMYHLWKKEILIFQNMKTPDEPVTIEPPQRVGDPASSALGRPKLYFFGGGATFSSHQSNLVEPSFASLPGMSEFSLSLTPK
jgi:hypothetical protein